ncbi:MULTISPECIES: ABC transporter ATP-binding protein [unclassified Cryobacterium]|uniref:ABC transporter ATP-binding protein n=1 Tax=unclassified Cryobacterium TaxID=2649013 RepID=UPI002AB54527|nr:MULTISPECIES: ABC transporter ATP-binding protein [unclassified Cryobacterium]MDY7528677.1 ABC transporter ATP-binding protein [Cryobacterium sp. 10C2]MDY7555580.1 ABC transporter ATP-binding protein [Cryobacterium sp. 10C3]MEB0202927.1 ABC transporter ATP-binding protein [Cryobacterium sp. 5I3]MEB0287092.1 ABC transporter ATP-binding protein [Cryobacterium sp. 10S3]MEB0291231.1 ABC transporter ATP-binding protein [Cryobacterium sp. 10C2]
MTRNTSNTPLDTPTGSTAPAPSGQAAQTEVSSSAATHRHGAVVEFSGVTKDFGGHRALAGFDLTLHAGEFVALLGPSGSGKTTALRALAGLESTDAGIILVDGVDVSTLPTSRRDMGMVFQAYSLFPHLSAGENVEFGLRMRGVAAAARRRRAGDALALVGLADHYDRFAHQLSGGQQQRVALARALVTEPRVLLLDEPLSALDAKVRVTLREEIRRIQTELGITTLFVTHDQDEALAIADRVAVMRDGRIEQVGTPEDLYSRPVSPFIADFVGLSNQLTGMVRNGFAELYGTRLPLLDPSQADGTVLVAVRPEDLELAADGVEGVVTASSFHGSLRRTRVRFADGAEVSVQHGVRVHPAPGDAVRVRFTGAPVSVAAAANPVQAGSRP